MTPVPQDPEDPRDRRPGDHGRRLDEDAAWRAIVENYGDPALGPEPEPPAPEPEPEPERPSPQDERLRGLFQPSWNDPLETEATWDDEGHFVPPTPPPVVARDPRRRAAWIGLFGSPTFMLIAVVLGWNLPDWFMLGLAGAFAGGFIYLVATMQNRRPGDGGDGAVV